MDQLYQEIILDHYKHPHGRGLREPYAGEAHHVNPTCGDEITVRVTGDLADIPGVRIFGLGGPEGRGGTVSFDVAGVHPHDVGQILDDLGVEVRVGHHCARPVCARFGVAAMTRASFYLYTTTDEIDALARGIEQVRRVFG